MLSWGIFDSGENFHLGHPVDLQKINLVNTTFYAVISWKENWRDWSRITVCYVGVHVQLSIQWMNGELALSSVFLVEEISRKLKSLKSGLFRAAEFESGKCRNRFFVGIIPGALIWRLSWYTVSYRISRYDNSFENSLKYKTWKESLKFLTPSGLSYRHLCIRDAKQKYCWYLLLSWAKNSTDINNEITENDFRFKMLSIKIFFRSCSSFDKILSFHSSV